MLSPQLFTAPPPSWLTLQSVEVYPTHPASSPLGLRFPFKPQSQWFFNLNGCQDPPDGLIKTQCRPRPGVSDSAGSQPAVEEFTFNKLMLWSRNPTLNISVETNIIEPKKQTTTNKKQSPNDHTLSYPKKSKVSFN